MANVDALRLELRQAIVDVVDKLDDRGIPIRGPDEPLVGRVPLACECGSEVSLSYHDNRYWCPGCYDTREAAEAAREEE